MVSISGGIPALKSIKSYWKITKGNEVVLAAIRLCHTELGLSAGDLQGHCEAIKLHAYYTPTKRTVDRLLRGTSKVRNAAHVLGLMLVAQDVFSKAPVQSQEMKDLALRIDGHIANLGDLLGEQFPSVTPRKRVEPRALPVADERPAVNVVGLIQLFLGVPSTAFEEMNREFFPGLRPDAWPESSVEKYFNMYRFHGHPRKIVKTFTVLKSPIASRPFMMFTNFFHTGSATDARRSEGIIIPTKDYLYFIGGVNDGVGLKLIALERKPHSRLNLYHGLTITFDEDEDMVAARCIVIPTDAESHEEAGAGIYAVEDADPVIRGHLEELRNRIPFELEQGLKLDGKPITQQHMVSEVGKAIESESGPRLAFDDGHAFNPADHRWYTFNAALKTWHGK
jgi:hypothetical protein